jgi:flagellar biogenesis protein FliO
METNLRPLTLGEILDRTALLYRSNFVLFAGIFSVYAGVVLVVNLLQIGVTLWLSGLHIAAWIWVLTGSAVLIKVLLVFLFAGASVAAISRAVAWVHLGEPATIRGAYSSILPRLGRYLWLMTITFFAAWLPAGLVYGGYIAVIFFSLPKGFMAHPGGANQSSMMLFGVASLIFILLLIPAFVYGVVMMLRYALAVPASVVENLKAVKAIRRSIDLSKGARGRIFVLGLLVFVIEVGLVGLSQFFFFVMAFKQHGHVGPAVQALSQIIAFFTNAFLGPIYATGLTLFYYDQRVRKEGYDIEWMMQAAGLTMPAQEPTQATGSEPGQTGEPV